MDGIIGIRFFGGGSPEWVTSSPKCEARNCEQCYLKSQGWVFSLEGSLLMPYVSVGREVGCLGILADEWVGMGEGRCPPVKRSPPLSLI